MANMRDDMRSMRDEIRALSTTVLRMDGSVQSMAQEPYRKGRCRRIHERRFIRRHAELDGCWVD